MDISSLLYDLIFDYTLRTVALGAGVLGIVAGVLGVFALLRQQSLLGDAISHAALPGIVLSFLLFRSKAPLALVLGAMVAGWLSALVINLIVNRTPLKQDSALGLVLSVFFGLGMMMLTFTQRMPDARQAGLDKFLFGQAATLLAGDVVVMAILGSAALILVVAFWKEFKLLSFDPDFAHSLGLPVRGFDLLLTALTVLAIVIGLQAVGVVLMSAMIVAPAAAARQWTDRLGWMAVLSALFGGLAGLGGTLVSATTIGLSTGPTIVLAASLIVLVSILFAPQRGLIAGLARRARQSRQIQVETVLLTLFELGSAHTDPYHPHTEGVLRTAVPRPASVPASLRTLSEHGWVQARGTDGWSLTPIGLEQARRLAEER